jgi:hypothetical protein
VSHEDEWGEDEDESARQCRDQTNMKKSIEVNTKLNMRMSMKTNENMNEFKFGRETHDECKEQCEGEDETDRDAANGKEILSICQLPRRPNQSRGGGR